MAKLIALAGLMAGLFITAFAGPASASVIYNLTLTATADTDGTPLSTYNGTGTITLDFAPSATGQTSYSPALEAVTFLIDGESFSGNASSVQFLNGIFRNATFAETKGNTPFRFTLDTTGTFAFFYADGRQDATGTITSSLAATTPLPGALPLFAGGLGVMGLLNWRRKRTAQAH
jgi:hypothetical protein